MGISFREDYKYKAADFDQLSSKLSSKEVTPQQIHALQSLGYKIKNGKTFKRVSKRGI